MSRPTDSRRGARDPGQPCHAPGAGGWGLSGFQISANDYALLAAALSDELETEAPVTWVDRLVSVLISAGHVRQ
jgi:hypothetical protein